MEARLKPQDVVLALKLVARGEGAWTQPELASKLHISVSEVNHGLKRLAACHLYNPRERRVIRANLRELLVSGLRYIFPARPGAYGKGMPTAASAHPLADKLRHGDDDDATIWPSPNKHYQVRGRLIDPLYRTAPLAASEDPVLHELLAMCDALRGGRARERALARDELSKRLAA